MQQQSRPQQDPALVQLLGRALIDADFRKRLESEPERMATEYQLSPASRQKLRRMDSGRLDEAASELAGRADVRIFIGISGHFNSTE
jgi:hypothetical protein